MITQPFIGFIPPHTEDQLSYRQERKLEKLHRHTGTIETETLGADVAFSYCPKCGCNLEEILFRGIMVDRCMGCYGVWLEASELDRLTARAGQGWLSHFWRNIGR
jgi:uncharacterized protein